MAGLHSPLNFARYLAVPENRSALLAMQCFVDQLGSRMLRPQSNPIFVHGKTGTGKSYLVNALCEEATRRLPTMVISCCSARELELGGENASAARSSDLVVCEDLQFMPQARVDSFCHWLDDLVARHVQVVLTAALGPNKLPWSRRAVSRVAAGLVVGIEPLGAASRLILLEEKAQRRQLAIRRDVLESLAQRLTGGFRQLEGTITRLEALTKQRRKSPELSWIDECFTDDLGEKLTTETIAQRVGLFFRVDAKQMRSAHRGRRTLLPRQLSMYLARAHADASLDQIGSYFGRDHTTVLHACRKVERMIHTDTYFAGLVRQLSAEIAP